MDLADMTIEFSPGGAMPEDDQESSIDLYWLPLGAGGKFVRLNGRVYEAVIARHQRRVGEDLYHAALEVRDGGKRFVIEMGPVWNNEVADRGVVCEGPVGSKWLGRSRLFRYEVRLWREGSILDVAEAVESPQRLSNDRSQVARLIKIIPSVPPMTWGRDELKTGDMWNSNSLISWLLASIGSDMTIVHPPIRGRAPGWRAGLILASRQ